MRDPESSHIRHETLHFEGYDVKVSATHAKIIGTPPYHLADQNALRERVRTALVSRINANLPRNATPAEDHPVLFDCYGMIGGQR